MFPFHCLIWTAILAAILNAFIHWKQINMHRRIDHGKWATIRIGFALLLSTWYFSPFGAEHTFLRWVWEVVLLAAVFNLFFSFWFRSALNLMRVKDIDYFGGQQGRAKYNDIILWIANRTDIPPLGIALFFELLLPFLYWFLQSFN